MQKSMTYIKKPESGISLFLKKLRKKISSLFELEEVEVTFKVEGKKVSYTYTKVEENNAA